MVTVGGVCASEGLGSPSSNNKRTAELKAGTNAPHQAPRLTDGKSPLSLPSTALRTCFSKEGLNSRKSRIEDRGSMIAIFYPLSLILNHFDTSFGRLLNRPSVLGDVDPVAFDIFDPALRDRSVGVVLGFGVGNFLDFFDAIDFETKVMDSPRIFLAMYQSEIEMAVGEINSAPRSAVFFFHAEDTFVILCGLVEILDVDRNMPDSWFFHDLPPFSISNSSLY